MDKSAKIVILWPRLVVKHIIRPGANETMPRDEATRSGPGRAVSTNLRLRLGPG